MRAPRDGMTTKIVAGVVDVVVLRRVGRAWRVLTLQRAAGVRSTGAWEIVHGSIEPRETPVQAALRELREETGFAPERLYSITTNPFYLSRSDTIQVAVAFAAVVTSAKFTLGAEHSRAKWETFAAARKRLAWPRTHDLLRQVAWILRGGDAGAVEDVLRSG
ncbi:MAG: hypothetical protein CK531_05185 [Gemmatimonadetes bacterium]|nr:MAG: hypothetical protein CK531_05185 [Gemmatimonadota bacterium]